MVTIGKFFNLHNSVCFFSVGGSLPVIFAYYTEFQAKKNRGSMVSMLATFWMSGNIVCAGKQSTSVPWVVFH